MMTSRNTPVAESMTQLQQQFEEFRGTRTGRRKLPEGLWQLAVEEARQHGVNVVAHALRLDYTALKRRLSGASTPERRTAPPAFVELMGATVARTDEYVNRVRVCSQSADAGAVEGRNAAGLDGAAARLAGSVGMIQITPQMRVLVAIESVDGR